jgi:hypothetical protein
MESSILTRTASLAVFLFVKQEGRTNMTEQKDKHNQTHQSTEQSDEKKVTLADYAAKKLGFPNRKLPKDWCRAFFRK